MTRCYEDDGCAASQGGFQLAAQLAFLASSSDQTQEERREDHRGQRDIPRHPRRYSHPAFITPQTTAAERRKSVNLSTYELLAPWGWDNK